MYVSRATLTPAGKLRRHGVLEAGAEADFGVHGPIAEFFKLASPTPLPLPVEAVDRTLAKHQEECPTAATLKPAVAVSWTAEIEEY